MKREVIFTAEVELTGTTPMLHNKIDPDSLKKKKSRNAETSYDDEWKRSTHINSKGEVIITDLILSAMLDNASKGVKIGKQAVRKLAASGVLINEDEINLKYKGKVITLDDIQKNHWLFINPVRIKGNVVLKTRTMIPIGWSAIFTCSVLTNQINKDTLYDLFDTAGSIAGLLDWRPSSPKPGKFGQFEVTKFEII